MFFFRSFTRRYNSTDCIISDYSKNTVQYGYQGHLPFCGFFFIFLFFTVQYRYVLNFYTQRISHPGSKASSPPMDIDAERDTEAKLLHP